MLWTLDLKLYLTFKASSLHCRIMQIYFFYFFVTFSTLIYQHRSEIRHGTAQQKRRENERMVSLCGPKPRPQWNLPLQQRGPNLRNMHQPVYCPGDAVLRYSFYVKYVTLLRARAGEGAA